MVGFSDKQSRLASVLADALGQDVDLGGSGARKYTSKVHDKPTFSVFDAPKEERARPEPAIGSTSGSTGFERVLPDDGPKVVFNEILSDGMSSLGLAEGKASYTSSEVGIIAENLKLPDARFDALTHLQNFLQLLNSNTVSKRVSLSLLEAYKAHSVSLLQGIYD